MSNRADKHAQKLIELIFVVIFVSFRNFNSCQPLGMLGLMDRGKIFKNGTFKCNVMNEQAQYFDDIMLQVLDKSNKFP